MLKTYREKRDFSKTPEPKGHKKSSPKNSKSLSFVVQEHAATRLHFDFRLEANGVLLSWAVPKGPSLNPHEKRLAVMTEDHPLDYAGFEGVIPSGYGAGEVIVWDNGTYAPLNSNEMPAKNRDQAEKLIKAGLRAGKLSFELAGHKLQGIWTLVRLKNKEKEWLLIKHEDKFANSDGHPWQDDSILSGQTLEDLRSGRKKRSSASNSAKRKIAKRKTIGKTSPKAAIKKKTLSINLPAFKSPMLATLATDIFTSPVIDTDTKSFKQVTPNKSISKKNAKSSNIKDADIESLLTELDNDKENLELQVQGNLISLSHLNKIFWPKYKSHKAITKRDYLHYLITISPWLLPHLKDRLITLIRFPQGIEGGKFFQKHWQENLPDFVQTVNTYTEHEKKDLKFLLCNNLSTLIWLGQIADLELHTSHTRISNEPDAKKLPKTFTGSLANIDKSLLNYPDYIVFDLDPYLYSGKENKGAEPELHRKGFRKASQVALWLKELFDELSIKAFIKTSGKTGLHVYVPIERNLDYDTVRDIAETIGRYLLERHADSVTMDWSVVKRTGKVFFDHNMNARSKSLASIYSPRVSKEAAVSTPIEWSELDKVYPADFTIETLPVRLSKSGDLWADILSSKNNLQDLLRSNFMKKATSSKKTKDNKLRK